MRDRRVVPRRTGRADAGTVRLARRVQADQAAPSGAAAGRRVPTPALSRGDLVAVGLLLGLGGWAVVVSWQVGGDPAPLAGLSLGMLGVLIVARLLGPWASWLAPLAVLLAAAALVAQPMGGTTPSGVRYGPLVYANATAAFYLLATAAAVMLAAGTHRMPVRLAAAAAALASAAAVIDSRSQAGAALLLLVAVAVLARRRLTVRALLVAGALAVLAAVSVTAWLGATHASQATDGEVRRAAASTLSERRLELWQDGLDLAITYPVTGVGPGRFRVFSPTSRSDQDAFAAHHEYLQTAAELGLPGGLLVLGLVGWGYAALWRRADRIAAVAGAALTATAVHATVDYVLHAPAVPLALVALVAGGSAVGRDVVATSPTEPHGGRVATSSS